MIGDIGEDGCSDPSPRDLELEDLEISPANKDEPADGALKVAGRRRLDGE